MSPRLRLPGFRRAPEQTEPETPEPAPPEAPEAPEASGPADAAEPLAAPMAAEPAAPEPAEPPAAAVMPGEEPEEPGSVTVEEGVACLAAYPRAILSWVAEDGYPMNLDLEIEVKLAESIVRFAEHPGFHIAPGTTVAITASQVHPLREGGFDERRHVTVWGQVSARPRGRFAVTPSRVWAWGEDDLALTASYNRRLPQARRYFEALSAGHTVAIRPRLSARLALFRAAHAPFLRATFVPLLLGLAVAVRAGVVDFATALMMLALAGAVHLGLNVAGGLFDLLHDPRADGHRPAWPGISMDSAGDVMAEIGRIPRFALGCYVASALLGLALLVLRGSPAVAAVAVVGIFLVVAYKTPPLKLADRGLGEASVALGFGPVLLLGAYAVQSRGALSSEAILLSIPIGLLAGLVVYVGGIPNRVADARAGRMTLPVRWSKAIVILGFDLALVAAFVTPVLGVAAGLLPIPVLLALLALPLARHVRADLTRHYETPSALTAALMSNDRLYLNVGLLLMAGYLLTIADQIFLMRAPFLR